MKTLATLISAATLAVASTAASAWGWGPFGNGYDGYNNGWGDGYGDFDGGFSMNFSGRGHGRGHGRGYGYGYDAPYYGYAPYGVAPYGFAPVAAPVAPQAADTESK